MNGLFFLTQLYIKQSDTSLYTIFRTEKKCRKNPHFHVTFLHFEVLLPEKGSLILLLFKKWFNTQNISKSTT